MSVISSIVDIASSGGLGAIVGAVGGIWSKIEERKTLALSLKRDFAMASLRQKELLSEQQHELAMADKEVRRAEVEGELVVQQIETQGFVESIKQQGKMVGIPIVDGIRSLMRPVITVFLLTLTTILFFQLHDMVDGLESVPPETILAIYITIIKQIIFLTVTATAWWFASRPARVQINSGT